MSIGSEMLLERVRAATADEYVIEREIGRGGMAAVFLALDIALNRPVAIKVMLPDLLDVEGIPDRFMIEARMSAQLDHPGIVTVYAVKQRAGLHFIVMKYVEGHTLEGVLKAQGTLPPATAASIVGRVAEALHFAHGEGVVHRDVKPSNILIDARGRPIVTDFGIARDMTAQSITVAGSMLGTPSYMSPEQCRGWPATAASDQYALGVTMYEMLAGRRPFMGSLLELLNAHRDESPPPISQFLPGIDPVLEETVMRMLAKNPQERWATLTDVAELLATNTTPLPHEEGLGATPSSIATESRRATPRAISWVSPLATIGRGGPTPTPTPPNEPLGEGSLTATTADRAGALEPVDVGVGDFPEAKLRRTLIGSAALLMIVLAVSLLVWTQLRPRSAPAVVQASSLPRSDTVRPLTELPAPSSDSAQVADSATAPAVEPIPTAPARDSSPKTKTLRPAPAISAANTPPPRPAKDSSLVTGRSRESVGVECARLLERVSLGEKLTEAERATLRRRCARGGL